MDLPTMEMLPTITRASIDVDAAGNCRFEILCGDRELFSEECHVDEVERWQLLHQLQMSAILKQHGKEVERGPIEHWRKVSSN